MKKAQNKNHKTLNKRQKQKLKIQTEKSTKNQLKKEMNKL